MMLQDIYPSKLNNQYNPAIKAAANDIVVILEGNTILIRECKASCCCDY